MANSMMENLYDNLKMILDGVSARFKKVEDKVDNIDYDEKIIDMMINHNNDTFILSSDNKLYKDRNGKVFII